MTRTCHTGHESSTVEASCVLSSQREQYSDTWEVRETYLPTWRRSRIFALSGPEGGIASVGEE